MVSPELALDKSLSTQQCVRIIYTSHAVDGFSADELSALGRKCIQNNRRCGLNGVLLFSSGFFIQCIEGDKQTVATLYEKIKVDPRHTELSLVLEEPIQTRLFEQWSMGLLNLDMHVSNRNRKRLDKVIAYSNKHGRVMPDAVSVLSAFREYMPNDDITLWSNS